MMHKHETASRSLLIDAATGRAICDGVGERLRDSLRRAPPYSAEIAQLLRRLEHQDQLQSAE